MLGLCLEQSSWAPVSAGAQAGPPVSPPLEAASDVLLSVAGAGGDTGAEASRL